MAGNPGYCTTNGERPCARASTCDEPGAYRPRGCAHGVPCRPFEGTEAAYALRDARRTFLFLAFSAFVTLLALMLTVRAVRSDAALASMKSDFVSAVTHELKTPLALIRLVGDTLTNRRYSTPEAVQDYARLLSQEASRLGDSIDTLRVESVNETLISHRAP